jgi:hypothetical protein
MDKHTYKDIKKERERVIKEQQTIYKNERVCDKRGAFQAPKGK